MTGPPYQPPDGWPPQQSPGGWPPQQPPGYPPIPPYPPYGYPYPQYPQYPQPPYPPQPGPPRPASSGWTGLLVAGMAALGLLLSIAIAVAVGWAVPEFGIAVLIEFLITVGGGVGLLLSRKRWAIGLACGLMIGWALSAIVGFTLVAVTGVMGAVGEIMRDCAEVFEGSQGQ